MRVLLLGSLGQLGISISVKKPKEIELIALSKAEMDITNQDLCESKIALYKPDWIINAAAYTNVDMAEKNKDLAYKVNQNGPELISKLVAKYGGKLLHISTDFVFNGKSNNPYKPYDNAAPISVYGLSKLYGEKNILNILKENNRAIILRTSWLMGPYGKNFAKTILKLHSEKGTIKVVNDQVGCPTSTISLANICWEIILKNKINNNLLFPRIMHWRDEGITNWYEIAKEIGIIGLKLNKISKIAKIEPIKSKEYITLAKRPLYSVLDITETKKLLQVNPLNWRQSIFDSFKNYS